MSYLYCLDITIKTQDDVNAMFRDAQLKGEITMTPDGKVFLCPQLSHTMWSLYPQSKKLPTTVDSQWNSVISDCIALLEKHYKISYAIDELGWKKIDVVY